MAKLTIFKNKNELRTLELDTAKEYIAGRASQCDIILEDAFFSRQHFKLYYQNNHWAVQSLSKYSQLALNDKEQDYFKLKSGDNFKTFTYSFIFESETLPETVNIEATTVLMSENNQDKTPIVVDNTQDNSYVDEKTFVPEAASQDWSFGVPYIIMQKPESSSQTLRLEGDYWVIGRDETCDIIIDDPKSSREHCEIFCKNNKYYILDKNSSNGTILNYKKVSPEKEVSLKSGDQIQIGKLVLVFEIRDPLFTEKISHFPVPAYSEPSTFSSEQKAIKLPPSYQQNKKFLIGGAVAFLLLLFFAFSGNDNTNNQNQMASKNGVVPTIDELEKLSPQQKEFIDKSYNLAKTLYTQGKYELALTEVEKIHNLIPEYKDSKEIRQYCKNAIDTLMDQKEIERREADTARLAEKVESIVDECSRIYSSNRNIESLDNCLAPALELDPENQKIKNLRSIADQDDAKRDQEQDKKNMYKNRIAERKKIFQKAEAYKKSGQLLNAISTYGRHIASALPDPENLESKSRQEVKNLQQKVSQEIEKLKADASSAYSKKDYKTAVKKLEVAIKLNPQDQSLRNLHGQYSKTLLNFVKNLYGDSVIDENLGNIEAAKEKWGKIRSSDVEYGEYYKKAGNKLKKYGL